MEENCHLPATCQEKKKKKDNKKEIMGQERRKRDCKIVQGGTVCLHKALKTCMRDQ